MNASPRAWGWVAHLRDGGTTPWASWHGNGARLAEVLPGAQQLELLRRLNVAARQPLAAGVADRVLAAAAAGRGKPDLALLDADRDRAQWGPLPVDPSTLGADELLRVASTLLAHDLVALGPDPVPDRYPWPMRTRYRLVGDPIAVATLRDSLVARGRAPGGANPTVLVLGGPFDRLLADTWTRRCFERGSGGWNEWQRFWRDRTEVPSRLDLAAAAQQWVDRRSRVHVVGDPAAHRRQMASLLGVRRLPQIRTPGADSAELARRIATVVGLLVPAHERPALMSGTLWRRIPITDVAPVAVGDQHREWIERAADRVRRDLQRAGYPVLGDLADLTPRFADEREPAPNGVHLDDAVLDLAIGMIVDDTWQRQPRSVHA